MDTLSLCLICKNENDYLQEWLDYHILVGVERFYIYDNESGIPVRQTLAEYIEKGWVVVIEISGHPVQMEAYDHCITCFGKSSQWIGFIDTDEFLVPKNSLDIKEVLFAYEHYGGLAVNSFFFGSNGHQKRPIAGQLVGYQERTGPIYAENDLVKSIVRPEAVQFSHTPHDFFYKQGWYAVNEEGKFVDNQRHPHRSAVIQLNHYYCRSEEEILQKLSRGRGAKSGAWGRGRFDVVNKLSSEKDITALDLLKRIFELDHGQIWNPDWLDAQNTGLCAAMHELVSTRQPTVLEAELPESVTIRPEYLEWKQSKIALNQTLQEKDFSRHKVLLEEQLKRNPDCVFSLTDLGKFYSRSGEFEQAWKVISHAWEITHGSYLVLGVMTDYFRRTKQLDMAQKTVLMRLEYAAYNGSSLTDLALVLMDQGQLIKGLEVGLPVIQRHWVTQELQEGVAQELVVRMSEALLAAGGAQQAVDLLKQATRSMPPSSQFYTRMAKAYLALKNRGKAREMTAEARRINPADPDLSALAKI
jgi:tetratricopeptide (TPR) repeat protein